MTKVCQRETLPGGAELLTVPMAATTAGVIQVSVKVGSRYETKAESGLSHFIEHMFFKGSANYPSMRSLASALDGLGAEFNAWTGKELTEYYIKVPAEELERAIGIMADLFLRPLFPEEECQKEQGVILQEINLVEDSPERYVEDLMEATLYAHDPIGRLVIGTRETVRTFHREQLVRYQTRHYLPRRTLITLAGRLSDKAIKRTKETFSFSRPGQIGDEKQPAAGQLPRIHTLVKPTEQAHLSLGFLGYHFSHPKRVVARILSMVLGGMASSRLFQELREARGLCYYIRSHQYSYSDTGYLEIHAGLDPKRLNEALTVMLDECRKLRDELVVDQELLKAKQYAKGRLLLHLEQSEALADFYATQRLLGQRMKSPAEVVSEIEQVTAEEIRAVARDIVDPDRAALALIGQAVDRRALFRALRSL